MQLADLREAGRAAVKESRGFCERGRHDRLRDLAHTVAHQPYEGSSPAQNIQ